MQLDYSSFCGRQIAKEGRDYGMTDDISDDWQQFLQGYWKKMKIDMWPQFDGQIAFYEQGNA